ncbi:SpoIIE family protein phosphatase [Actinoplanes sp. NPDC026619]|uniref:ATP-binding SpoIIE family protein phosphatase n=1 Tax=Actinoplanes sp. NPDC026619 TaxID=3155798 RepID=UPI0033F94341
MGRRMRELDWSASPLGPPESWPDELVSAVATMLASRAQIVIFFGPEYCALYNDAYIPALGRKHPGNLGRPGREMWTETWTVLQELFDGVRARDTAFFAPDHPFWLERHGFLEETYFDVSYDPIRSAAGVVTGIFCIVTDTTARVLGERRTRTLSARLRALVDVAAAVGTVRTTAEVLDVAARHVQSMTGAGRVVVTATGARTEVDGGGDPLARPDVRMALPDTAGATVGELRVWSGSDGPPEPEVLTQLARLIGLRLENARLYEAEHRIASTLQHSLLPPSLPRVPGAIVASRYLPGSSEAEVGGDWYDVIATPDDQLFLVIGDVVGKGVQAAAGMGQLRNALRAYILEGFDCGEALTRLNRLVENLGRRQFATVVCVRFDPATGQLHYSSAGHPPPILVRPGGPGEFLYRSALGPPIGALAVADYPTVEATLAPGSRLLLYTDGLVEDRRIGIDTGLEQLVEDAAKPADHVEELLDALLAKAARRPRRDDIALLALQATEPREFVLRLPADPNRLSVLRRRLDDFLTGHGVPEADVFDLTVAVSEAAANAIEHPIDPAEPQITIEAAIDDHAVVVSVHDSGRWRPSSSGGFRGRGLALIGALTELSVARSDGGTSVTLRRPLTR